MIDTKLLAPYPAPYSAPVRSKREPKPSAYAVSIQNFKEVSLSLFSNNKSSKENTDTVAIICRRPTRKTVPLVLAP